MLSKVLLPPALWGFNCADTNDETLISIPECYTVNSLSVWHLPQKTNYQICYAFFSMCYKTLTTLKHYVILNKYCFGMCSLNSQSKAYSVTLAAYERWLICLFIIDFTHVLFEVVSFLPLPVTSLWWANSLSRHSELLFVLQTIHQS